jgi:hypothetical protein
MANQAANPTAAPYVTGLWPISISGRFARVTNSIRERGAGETAGTKPPHEGEQQHGELQRAAHEPTTMNVSDRRRAFTLGGFPGPGQTGR